MGDVVVTRKDTNPSVHLSRWKKGDPFLDIPLDPTVPKALKGTFQETRYIQQLQIGKPTYHRLQKNKNEEANKYDIINPDNQVVPPHKTAHIYSFVILENETGALELHLGLGNHYLTAGRRDHVKAAGDIHLWKGEITKVTNQSGGYHSESEAVLDSARAAMEAVGLPMEKFVPYNKPEAERPVLFSNTLTFNNPLKPIRKLSDLVSQPEVGEHANSPLHKKPKI